MATNIEVLKYIKIQCSGAGVIESKEVKGDYELYCDGIQFGLLCDNYLFIEITDAGRNYLGEYVVGEPFWNSKSYFLIRNVRNGDFLSKLVTITVLNLPYTK